MIKCFVKRDRSAKHFEKHAMCKLRSADPPVAIWPSSTKPQPTICTVNENSIKQCKIIHHFPYLPITLPSAFKGRP